MQQTHDRESVAHRRDGKLSIAPRAEPNAKRRTEQDRVERTDRGSRRPEGDGRGQANQKYAAEADVSHDIPLKLARMRGSRYIRVAVRPVRMCVARDRRERPQGGRIPFIGCGPAALGDCDPIYTQRRQ